MQHVMCLPVARPVVEFAAPVEHFEQSVEREPWDVVLECFSYGQAAVQVRDVNLPCASFFTRWLDWGFTQTCARLSGE